MEHVTMKDIVPVEQWFKHEYSLHSKHSAGFKPSHNRDFYILWYRYFTSTREPLGKSLQTRDYTHRARDNSAPSPPPLLNNNAMSNKSTNTLEQTARCYHGYIHITINSSDSFRATAQRRIFFNFHVATTIQWHSRQKTLIEETYRWLVLWSS